MTIDVTMDVNQQHNTVQLSTSWNGFAESEENNFEGPCRPPPLPQTTTITKKKLKTQKKKTEDLLKTFFSVAVRYSL